MLTIIYHYFFFLIVIFGNGLFFRKLLNLQNQLNLYSLCIYGIIFTSVISYILNFFTPLNDALVYINFTISVIFIFLNRKYLKKISPVKHEIYIFIIIFIVTLTQIYSSGFSDDLSHYHAGSIENTDNFKNIFGLNFLHHHYGYSSIWLILQSYLNFNNFLLQDIHVSNGLIFSLFLLYLFYELINNQDKKTKFFLVFFLIFFFIKYTRIKDFGIDRPGIIILCFLLVEYLKYLQYKILENKILFLLCFVSFFLVLSKIFFVFSILIPFYYFIKLNNKINFILSKYFLILILLCSTYFLKNTIISGCLIYPVEQTCIKKLNWDSSEIVKKLYSRTAASTKSFEKYKGNLDENQYIKGFNWFDTWFKRNGKELLDFFFTVFFSYTLAMLSFSLKICILKKKYIFLFLFLFLFNLLLFYLTPVVRYHNFLFIIFFMIFSEFMQVNKIKLKIFLIIIFLATSYNFGKNFTRIIDAKFINNPEQFIRDIGWYQYPKKKYLNEFEYYNGWIGNSPIGNEDLSQYTYRKIFNYVFIEKK